jgi:hypothetical protein
MLEMSDEACCLYLQTYAAAMHKLVSAPTMCLSFSCKPQNYSETRAAMRRHILGLDAFPERTFCVTAMAQQKSGR